MLTRAAIKMAATAKAISIKKPEVYEMPFELLSYINSGD
jgi:hypothetical protein